MPEKLTRKLTRGAGKAAGTLAVAAMIGGSHEQPRTPQIPQKAHITTRSIQLKAHASSLKDSSPPTSQEILVTQVEEPLLREFSKRYNNPHDSASKSVGYGLNFGKDKTGVKVFSIQFQNVAGLITRISVGNGNSEAKFTPDAIDYIGAEIMKPDGEVSTSLSVVPVGSAALPEVISLDVQGTLGSQIIKSPANSLPEDHSAHDGAERAVVAVRQIISNLPVEG